MGLGNVARVALLGAACFAAVGSATSNQNANNQQQPYANDPVAQQQPMQNNNGNAPPPQQMDASRALGLWRSTFGAVKIEADDSKGGLQSGAVHGVWIYQRKGQEVTGYFHGSLRGNVLQFQWQEPNNPPLVGEGYIAFDQSGRQYSGRWWTERRDRIGDWNGWRDGASQQMGQSDLPPPPPDDNEYQQPQPRRYAPPPQQQQRPRYPTYPAPQQPQQPAPQQPAPQQPPNDPYY